jgi:D-xylose 1-dehydrogenase (NADP+, D-xylono-1,5-lactone-forming)
MGLRVGLLSTARINRQLLAGASTTDAVDVVAVASRDEDRAQAYAAEHGLERAHGSYEALLADPEVDAVYISLPNSLHVPWSVRALEAGKHVLCEKPLARRPEEAERAFAVAEREGRVLAEAFMWRHHPQTKRLVEIVEEGTIGELRLVRCAFSFPLAELADVRLQPELDGGSLMDVGCYCVSATRLLAGEPEEFSAVQVLAPSGVDVRFAGAMRHPRGVVSHFDCAFDLPNRGRIEAVGSDGSILVPDPWHVRSPGLELRRGDTSEPIEIEHADSYGLELADFARGIAGRAEPLLGRADAVGQAHALAALYDAAGGRG